MMMGEFMSLALQAVIVVESIFAGMFWLASARGVVSALPWRPAQYVSESERAGHQAKWNGRAALCAAVAAIFQGILVVYEHWPQVPH